MVVASGERAASRPIRAASLLLATQVFHALTPADTEAEGYVGLVAGTVLLVANAAAIYGLGTGRRWGRPLAGWTGVALAAGFVLYHLLPFHSAVTNPYPGEGVGALAWVSVALTVGAGLWTAYEGLVVRPGAPV